MEFARSAPFKLTEHSRFLFENCNYKALFYFTDYLVNSNTF